MMLCITCHQLSHFSEYQRFLAPIKEHQTLCPAMVKRSMEIRFLNTKFCMSFSSKFCTQLEVGLFASKGGECILALVVSHFYNSREYFLQVIWEPSQSHIMIVVGVLSPNLVNCVFFFKSLKSTYI